MPTQMSCTDNPKWSVTKSFHFAPELGFWVVTEQSDSLIDNEYVATDPTNAVLLADKLVTHWRRLGDAIKAWKLKKSSVKSYQQIT